ncbi:quinone-dependent dihydroorotate dehydrogenase [Paludibacterium yongneupense]|uniref:quinone-dependent dihydroorotate dehydrogenase n=1 Tax=Paludibacterium yongneupense TaxID=400061 RepID=UPI00048EB845|nr:quinone-dependent dihydroorotate dehydrogenase [Paludibacterium yongneupense]
MLYPLLRPFLFRLDPERAHDVTLRLLEFAHRSGIDRLLATRAAGRPVTAMGLRFPNPVGLAAGLDKNGAHIAALAALGFGFIEIGTVTPRAQPGNPKPRMLRLPQQRAIINRMGFNNDGVETLIENVRASAHGGIIGINIGKNAATPLEKAADDYLSAMDAVYPHASYIAVNVSSPNTRNLRRLQQVDELSALLAQLKERQQLLADTHGRYVPLALKIAPDMDDDHLTALARVLVERRVDGVIATNTTLARPGIADPAVAAETGGLSGAPLALLSTRVIALLARELDGALPIIGTGGIMSGKDAAEKMAAGANLIQIYSGLVYRGPKLVAECIKATAN